MGNRMFIEKFKQSIYTCFRCEHCRDSISAGHKVCPVRENTSGFETYTAKGKIMLIRGVIENLIPLSDDLAEVFYACTLCGNCWDKCYSKKFIDHITLFKAFRADLYQSNLVKPELRTLTDSIRKNGNPYFESPQLRNKWVEDLIDEQSYKKIHSPPHQIIYFAGCTTSYKRPEIAKSVFNILTTTNSDFGILKGEPCCGYPAMVVGDKKLAEELAQKNVESLEKMGAKTVVFSCAACYRTFKLDYEELVGKLNFELLHISELIHKLISERRLRKNKKIEMNVTYHDPCQIGRHLAHLKAEIYDQPREVLRQILNRPVVEMPRNKKNAWCCGAGGIMNLTSKEIMMSIANERVREAEGVGVDAIVTSCPHCKQALLDAITTTRLPLKVYDLSEIVAMSSAKDYFKRE